MKKFWRKSDMGDSENQKPEQEEELVDVAEFERQAQQQSQDVDEAEQAEADAEETVDVAELQASLETAQAKADENWDKFLRLQAEMDNLRRRNEKQVEDAHKFALKGFVDDLLPVVDSLEMGLQAEGDLIKIREGMELTLKQFQAVMERQKVVAVGAEGDQFDPELHQAVSMLPSEEHENNQLIHVMQKGYTLNGRLVRPAMVTVCKNQG